MVLTVTLARTAAETGAARAIEEAVFGESFGNTPEQLAAEYGPYEEASRFLLCRDSAADGPVAAARLIAASDAGLKTLVDIAAEPWSADPADTVARAGLDVDRTWDVATLAVLPHARRGHASAALYSALLATMTRAGGLSWTAIVDSKVLVLLRRAGVSVAPLPGLTAAPYLGSSSSVPVFGDLAKTRLLAPRRPLVLPCPSVRTPPARGIARSHPSDLTRSRHATPSSLQDTAPAGTGRPYIQP